MQSVVVSGPKLTFLEWFFTYSVFDLLGCIDRFKVEIKGSSFLGYAVNFNFTSHCNHLCFNQIESEALPFGVAMKTFVKGEHILLMLIQIDTKPVVRNF